MTPGPQWTTNCKPWTSAGSAHAAPDPTLADSEVITIELVGEFWELDTDRDLFRHFRRYHAAEFPALATSTAPPSPARPPTSGGSSS